ncbi:MAG: MFS transporter [Planctomycetaceae bacterium]|jgi:ACS family hexuronate transporter-like MFS transporter|nr:MFS transporter [Planctomycetaceae bacterium]
MQISNLRWWLCGLLFCATALSFLDRQVLSVVAPAICEELHIDNKTYSFITTAFMASYAVMFLLGGWFLDRVGTRLGLGVAVLIWTAASALHAIAVTPFQLGVNRFFLGFGEGACFPGAVKAVAEWFPAKQRALAAGIAIGGASLGGVLAPPLTVWLVGLFGWRGAFVATGLLGFLWVVCWFIFYHAPSKSPFITEQEKEWIESNQNERIPTKQKSQYSDTFISLLCRKEVLGLAFARFLFDPVFYFYMFWIPKYLHQERDLSLEMIGALTWIPFFALGVSNILGGLASDRLIASGVSVSVARKGIMTVSALLTVSSGLAAFASGAYTAIAMMSLLMFAHGFWITNYVTIIGDIFPKHRVATVMGITGMVGTIGGMGANTAIGFIVDRFSFLPVWIASGCLYPLALIVILMFVKNNLTNKSAGQTC